MSMLPSIGDLLTIIGVLILAIFVWAALSPFETLGWWAGWFGDKIYDDPNPPDEEVLARSQHAEAFIIFLSGVGRVSGEPVSYREQEFLRRLRAAMPNSTIVDDIFPYSVNNLPLTAHPYVGWLWRWALRRKKGNAAIIGYLINIRNIFQILASVDRRYGPMINQGLAEVLLAGLVRHGYDPQGTVPVYIIGYSGAGQMAVAPVIYLKQWLRAPIRVITLGGVFGSDPSLLVADHIYHLVGDSDSVERYRMVEPRNWPIFATSEWNRALRQGKITRISMGPMKHTGYGGYLDIKAKFPDGVAFVDRTVEVIKSVVAKDSTKVTLTV